MENLKLTRLSADHGEFENWLAQVLAAIIGNPGEQSPEYTERDSLDHYLRVYRRLLEDFDDLALARAGFLHGLKQSELKGNLKRFADGEVNDIVLGSNRLLAFAEGDPDVREQIGSILNATLPDPRGALLFVIEQCDRLDPTGAFAAWERASRATHCPLPDPTVPSTWKSTGARGASEFVNDILDPVCRRFHLWHERNLAAAAALYHEDRLRAMDLNAFIGRHSGPDSPPQKLKDWLSRKIVSVPGTEIEWEWHNLGTLNDAMPGDPNHFSEAHLLRCGYLAVRTGTEPQAFTTLGDIMSRAECLQPELLGFINQTALSMYRAIHIRVRLPQKVEEEVPFPRETLKLRLMSAEVAKLRYELARPELLQRAQEHFQPGASKHLRVFARDGKGFDLPRDACVLDFAHAIHSNLFLRIRDAWVNGERVDVFHRLNPGDVIGLNTDTEPRELPPDWERRAPNPARIRTMYSKYFAPVLRIRGRRWLADVIVKLGCRFLTDEELNRFVEPRLKDLKDRFIIRRADLEWFYRQLAALHAEGQFENLPNQLEMTPHERNRAIKALLEDLQIPSSSSELGRVPLMSSAHPTWNDSIRRAVIKLSEPRSILVVVNGSFGVLEKIGRAMREEEISVLNIAGLSTIEGFGRIRMEIPHISSAHVESILRRLQGIPETTLAEEITDRPHAKEEGLPPRRPASLEMRADPEPFQYVGPAISEPEYFYGRERELAKLREYHARACRAEDTGTIVCISGPRRIGKSSLVRHYLSTMARYQTSYCLTVAVQATYGMSWSDVERRLCDMLGKRLAEACQTLSISQPPPGNDLRSLVDDAVSLKLNVALAIDEVQGLFSFVVDSPDELDDLIRFFSWAKSRSGLMVIWSGFIFDPDPRLNAIIADSLRIELGPMPEGDVVDMLRMRKLGFSVSLPHAHARFVMQTTGGDPMLVAALGKEYWEIAPSSKRSPRAYSLPALKAAARRLPVEGSLFHDRLDCLRRGNDQEATRIILDALAWADAPGIMQEFRHEASGVITEADLETVLNRGLARLRRAGLVMRLVNPRKWTLTSDLLKKHLQMYPVRSHQNHKSGRTS